MVETSLNWIRRLMNYLNWNQADIKRRNMEIEFSHGYFLPFDRKDRIVLAELVDSVSDMAEASGFSICLSRLEFPSKGQGDFERFMEIIIDTMCVLRDFIEHLYMDMEIPLQRPMKWKIWKIKRMK